MAERPATITAPGQIMRMQARLEKGDLALSLAKAVKLELDPQNILISGASGIF